MKIKDILKSTGKPEIYTNGTSEMWTDEHISKLLLDVHINPEVDLASRKKSTIDNTVEWILDKVDKRKLNILDLGCGPGLYTEILSKKGHTVTGVDFSKNSIEYARSQANKNQLDIRYINENYIKLDLEENQFDLVILIYTDLGVLNPTDRDILLDIISKILKPGGVFIFDLANDKSIEEKVTPKSWEVMDQGFWKSEPYIALSESFLYEEEKVILSQHTVINEEEKIDVYRFWTHCFSHFDIKQMLDKYPYSDIELYEDVLPNGDLWTGDNVTFCRAVNNK